MNADQAKNAFATRDNKISGVYNDNSDNDDEEFDFTPQELENVNKLRMSYRKGKQLIHRQRQKKDGIMFGELKENVIVDSFTMGNDLTIPSKDDNENKLKVVPDLNKPILE